MLNNLLNFPVQNIQIDIKFVKKVTKKNIYACKAFFTYACIIPALIQTLIYQSSQSSILK